MVTVPLIVVSLVVLRKNQKKLEYQKELARQIEDKHRQLEALKEKEKREEQLLSKKLNEQLKAIQLEEQLEKEKERISRIAKNNIPDRISSNPKPQLDSLKISKVPYEGRQTQSEGNAKENVENKDNKVYKYFSNSARHQDYNKYGRQTFFDSYESDNSQFAGDVYRAPEDFLSLHTPCAYCDVKLKKFNYDTRSIPKTPNTLSTCENCEKMFAICSTCEQHNIPCLFCHRTRNVCLDCIRNFCIYCGNAMRNPTPSISSIDLPSEYSRRNKAGSERSFQILEISYEESDKENEDESDNPIFSPEKKPYSMNIDKNSIFHPDNKVIEPKIAINIQNGEVCTNIEIVKDKTNDRLSRYLKNYGDLTTRRNSTSRSTQTAQNDLQNNDVLSSMPLLRLPVVAQKQITSKQTNATQQSENMKTLSQKWEIPAVQKNVVSADSPGVLTQLGAIRKQLQIEQLDLQDAEKK